MKANPTEAKDVALYFLDSIGTERYTSAIIAKTIRQVKTAMESGYSKQEITDVIDHIIAKGIQMYSFGYVSTTINDMLKEIEEHKVSEASAKIKGELDKHHAESRKVVQGDDETARRNADKARNLGIKSRKRTESYLDMLKE